MLYVTMFEFVWSGPACGFIVIIIIVIAIINVSVYENVVNCSVSAKEENLSCDRCLAWMTEEQVTLF